ncbi:MAG: hypothetical protein JNK58_07980 [Phycisphaerae bacterium]|nr:hypothetical protein [Phycisphaerae bacterium]
MKTNCGLTEVIAGVTRLVIGTLWFTALLTLSPTPANGAPLSKLSTSEIITSPTGDGFLTVDISGTPSVDGLGSQNNHVVFLQLPEYTIYLIGIGWDVTLQTVIPSSRRSEIGVRISNSANVPGTGFTLTPGLDATPGGPTPYSSNRVIRLSEVGLPNLNVLPDRLLRLEFLETVDNAPGAVDGLWTSGSLVFETIIDPIPSAGTNALFLVGAVHAVRRFRSRPNERANSRNSMR